MMKKKTPCSISLILSAVVEKKEDLNWSGKYCLGLVQKSGQAMDIKSFLTLTKWEATVIVAYDHQQQLVSVDSRLFFGLFL